MLGRNIPYQPTAGTNLYHAEVVSTKIAVNMVKRSRRPLLVIGEYSGEAVKYLEDLKIEKVYTPREMNLLALIKRVPREGYDLVMFIGITYYYLNQGLTYLKHFSDVITLTLDGKYVPNAHYSFPNMEENEHLEAIKRFRMLLDNL
ncbi:MAG TPA: CO dehydrogenase/acetyl-CoA synthase complex subunit epsilon [Methanothermococcus okinawensis]|uniref:CO dehydrogenase/acetyl-CoA synthase complex subunit epsilon n=1 Tax=Methanothermococcus okinawensis TaxID=155863 RepID=A0A833DZQ6_9EURY|nr:CO dehydrogenase/acetyl-CoA synthase complex subunit epsilon [Methanococcaceae archaeon]HIP84137.1 CO dehydrogenase/acetyl-CoA synthase complex subunit epsilon [Methanothermococcus okinawensis]HIP91683.1 CO dehydrogenase/acetyl-CoA synthase complex subunit epsilon [Methanothermococcus okinawensis]